MSRIHKIDSRREGGFEPQNKCDLTYSARSIPPFPRDTGLVILLNATYIIIYTYMYYDSSRCLLPEPVIRIIVVCTYIIYTYTPRIKWNEIVRVLYISQVYKTTRLYVCKKKIKYTSSYLFHTLRCGVCDSHRRAATGDGFGLITEYVCVCVLKNVITRQVAYSD